MANGAISVEPAEPRVLLAELHRELNSAMTTATATSRGPLELAMSAARGLSEALESSQMLNAAPQLRDESGSYFLFQLPIQTADGWETGELKIYKRDAEKEIDPDNASMLLRLNMLHLGPVDAAIMVRNRAVSCDFRCERPESIRLLQSESKSLASAIEASGHPVRSINHQLTFAKPAVEITPSRHTGHIDMRA